MINREKGNHGLCLLEQKGDEGMSSKYPTDKLPQADNLRLVVRTVELVSQGAKTDEELAKEYGGYVTRQGRYYRKAAELLGFVTRPTPNQAVVTPEGQLFLQKNPAERRLYLSNKLAHLDVFKEVLEYLKEHPGANRHDLVSLLGVLVEKATENLRDRRLTTILNWLKEVEMIEERDGRYYLVALPRVEELTAFEDIASLPGTTRERVLRPYHEQTSIHRLPSPDRRQAVNKLETKAKKERADVAHQDLVRAMANHLLAMNCIPHTNIYVDLYANVGGTDFLFEMKSCTQENLHDQVRLGVAQLYEYRYLQRMPGATLVLVLQSKPSGDNEWLVDYLVQDRGIAVCWLEDGEFRYPPECTSLNALFGNAV